MWVTTYDLAVPGFAPQSTFKAVWDMPPTEDTWATTAVMVFGYGMVAVTIVVASVINHRNRKRRGATSPKVTRLATFACFGFVVFAVVGALVSHRVNRPVDSTPVAEARMLSQEWGVEVVDVTQLPGRVPAFNAPLTVKFGTNTVECRLTTYGARKGSSELYSNMPTPQRGRGRPQMVFDMWCPTVGDVVLAPSAD